jgi:hypothetical protein
VVKLDSARLRGLIKPEKMTMRQLVSVAAILAVIAALHPSKNLPLAKVRAFFGFIIEAVGFEV